MDQRKNQKKIPSESPIAPQTPWLTISRKLQMWYGRHERPLPWRVLWKKHQDPWHIWVSEIMLQQTVIKAVIPVYERFLIHYPSYHHLAQADSEDVRLAVRGLGYYRRFDMLHRAAKLLASKQVTMPTDYDEWKKLPGIGSYTAAALSSITLGLPVGVVDGNVERVLCRLLDIREAPNSPHLKTRFQVIMSEMCHTGRPGQLNQAVMELGQTLCTPTSPQCQRCPLTESCMALARKSQDLAPGPKKKTPKIDVDLQLLIAVDERDRIGLIQRPTSAKFLKKTWGFVTVLKQASQWQFDGDKRQSCQIPARAIGFINHTITNHKIKGQVMVSLYSQKDAQKSAIKWIASDDVEKNLVSNLDRKAWRIFENDLRRHKTSSVGV